ncbi:MAG TPA: hypothetical protein VIJ60_07055, partial [Acidimicrobiales bacterium]
LGPAGTDTSTDTGGRNGPGPSSSAGPPRIEIVRGLDHALLPATQRALVCDRLSEELARMVGRRPAVTVAGGDR